MSIESNNLPSASEVSHCRRVAMWSVELAKTMSCTLEEQNSLERAALAHHSPGASDEILRLELARILELANAIDERLEWQFFVTGADEEDPAVDAALKRLCLVAKDDIEQAIRTTPRLPGAAARCLELLLHGNAGVDDKDAIAASGPSALRATCAASLRSLFTDPALHRVWNHSLEVAQIAERLALASDRVHPSQAFVAGLLHDIGRLPMALLPLGFKQRFAQVFRKGCEPVLIERVFCSSTHSDAGAKVIQAWKLPPAIADAVEHHHEPERSDSQLAALLCLADDAPGISDDLPSIMRYQSALHALDLRSNILENIHRNADRPLNSLRFAA